MQLYHCCRNGMSCWPVLHTHEFGCVVARTQETHEPDVGPWPFVMLPGPQSQMFDNWQKGSDGFCGGSITGLWILLRLSPLRMCLEDPIVSTFRQPLVSEGVWHPSGCTVVSNLFRVVVFTGVVPTRWSWLWHKRSKKLWRLCLWTPITFSQSFLFLFPASQTCWTTNASWLMGSGVPSDLTVRCSSKMMSSSVSWSFSGITVLATCWFGPDTWPPDGLSRRGHSAFQCPRCPHRLHDDSAMRRANGRRPFPFCFDFPFPLPFGGEIQKPLFFDFSTKRFRRIEIPLRHPHLLHWGGCQPCSPCHRCHPSG